MNEPVGITGSYLSSYVRKVLVFLDLKPIARRGGDHAGCTATAIPSRLAHWIDGDKPRSAPPRMTRGIWVVVALAVDVFDNSPSAHDALCVSLSFATLRGNDYLGMGGFG